MIWITAFGIVASIFSVSVSAMTVDSRYVQERLDAHTYRIKASDVEHNFAGMMRRVLNDLSSLELSDADRQILENIEVGNYQVVKLFRFYANEMSEILNSEDVDAIRLGQLLMEARVEEQRFKSTMYREQIEHLSPAGQRIVIDACTSRSLNTEVVRRDYLGLASDVPEFVIGLAENFVHGMDKWMHTDPVKPEPRYTIEGDWGVIIE